MFLSFLCAALIRFLKHCPAHSQTVVKLIMSPTELLSAKRCCLIKSLAGESVADVRAVSDGVVVLT